MNSTAPVTTTKQPKQTIEDLPLDKGKLDANFLLTPLLLLCVENKLLKHQYVALLRIMM